MNRLRKLARWFLGLPITCPGCGEPTRHGHYVKGWEHEAGYWVCRSLLDRWNTTEPGGSTFGRDERHPAQRR